MPRQALNWRQTFRYRLYGSIMRPDSINAEGAGSKIYKRYPYI